MQPSKTTIEKRDGLRLFDRYVWSIEEGEIRLLAFANTRRSAKRAMDETLAEWDDLKERVLHGK